jgi:serine protease
MTHFRLAPFFVALLLGALPAVAGVAGVVGSNPEMGPRRARPAAAPLEDINQARVIVKYHASSGLMQALSARNAKGAKGSEPQHASAMSQRLGLPLQDGRVLGERTQALRGQGLSSTQLLARLREQADVEWAVLDEVRRISALPNDPYYGPNQGSVTPTVGQWYLRAPDSTVVSSINVPGAWDITPGSANITVAVLDTGVRFDHPDLAGKLHPGYDFITDNTNAGDGGGRDSDASDPGDWTTKDQCQAGDAATDSSWHGTQTAGIVGAATNNSVGMAGVGRNVMVLPVRVLGKCGGSDSDIIAAMRWSAGLSNNPVANPHPAQVISMSLGKSGSCPASYRDVFNELSAAGVTVVIAAGNGAGTAVEAPGNCAGALAVAGVRHIGTKVGFSSMGPEVSIAAPGGNCVNINGPCLYSILTTTNAGTTTPSSSTYSDSYNYSVGTSFSTPMVAGVVGLMLSVNPKLTPSQIRSVLQNTSRPFPLKDFSVTTDTAPVCTLPSAAEQVECHCTGSTCGAGMLDAAKAVAAVAPGGAVPPAALIDLPTPNIVVGDTVTLNGNRSSANADRSIKSYAWQISPGATQARFSGSISSPTASLVGTEAGVIAVTLTVTDNSGSSSTSSVALSVQATTPPSKDGGKSGGGGLSVAWVLLVLLATLLLMREQQRQQPQRVVRAATRRP